MASYVDWNEVILDLRRQGMSLAKISAAVGVGQSNLRWWGKGVEPRHRDGEALADLWCEVTGQPRATIPQLGRVPQAASRTYAMEIGNILRGH